VLEASWFGTRPRGPAARRGLPRPAPDDPGDPGRRVAPALRGRRTHAERLALALRLLAEDAWCDGLLGAPPVPFDALPGRMEALLCGGDAPPCPLIAYI
jgi:hypothetical protein